MQLVTDMETGGVAYYHVREGFTDGYRRLEYRVLPSMDEMREFVKALLADIPENIGCDAEGAIVQPEELRGPKRCRFAVAVETVVSHALALKALAAFRNNINDIANLDDLMPFDVDLKRPMEPPSYIT